MPYPRTPRLVLRDAQDQFCINGLAPTTAIPSTLQNAAGAFTLTRVTPTYVLYQETLPRPSQPSTEPLHA